MVAAGREGLEPAVLGVGEDSGEAEGDGAGASVGAAVGAEVGPVGLPDEAGAPVPLLPPPPELGGASAAILATEPVHVPPAASCTVTVG